MISRRLTSALERSRGGSAALVDLTFQALVSIFSALEIAKGMGQKH